MPHVVHQGHGQLGVAFFHDGLQSMMLLPIVNPYIISCNYTIYICTDYIYTVYIYIYIYVYAYHCIYIYIFIYRTFKKNRVVDIDLIQIRRTQHNRILRSCPAALSAPNQVHSTNAWKEPRWGPKALPFCELQMHPELWRTNNCLNDLAIKYYKWLTSLCENSNLCLPCLQ